MGSALEERNSRICDRYLKDGETAESLAIDSGLSVASVRVLLRDGGALKAGRPKVFRTDAEKVLSSVHARLGGILSHHRAFTRGIDRRMAADELNWSMQRVASVEKGVYNLTLIDLIDLARFLDKPIEEIFSGQSKAKHAAGDGPNLGVVPHPSSSPQTPKVNPSPQHQASGQPRWEPRLQNQKVA